MVEPTTNAVAGVLCCEQAHPGPLGEAQASGGASRAAHGDEPAGWGSMLEVLGVGLGGGVPLSAAVRVVRGARAATALARLLTVAHATC